MKTQCLFLLMCTTAIIGNAQNNLPEYKASNGITYHPGDTVRLARGSGHNGEFVYVQVAGLAQSTNPDDNNLGRTYAGANAFIKKIGNWKKKGADRFYFTVGVGLLTNYYLFIEDAIAKCEIADACIEKAQPAESKPDKYEQLKKLKELLDEGVINQEEFDKEKKKILEG